MGYIRTFVGSFRFNKKLDEETYLFLKKLAHTRRIARNLPSKYGIEGEFYVDGGGDYGQELEENIINYNKPPRTQPSLWLKWTPTEDRMGLEWNKIESFYKYVEWLEYLIEKILAPKGYILNGKVKYQGEYSSDCGFILVCDNKVSLEIDD